MKINLGDIYWLKVEDGISHPHVVIENNLEKQESKNIVVCALTTNMKKFNMPGNVLLEKGEAHLEKQSIVEVSKVLMVSKSDLYNYIGRVSLEKINEILKGIRFLKNTYFNDTSD